LIIASCTHPQGKVQKQIEAKEKELLADSSLSPDRAKANELIKLYISYADQFPDDTTAGTYLFKAGDIADRIRQPQQALDLFARVQRYQSNPKAAVALFLQGFINENELNDKVKAKSFYEEFLKKYPNHELSKDVRTTINNLGKTDEELIREFEAKIHAQDSLAKK
ncbi:MAG: tetratricopeptide repeat protein, partial [Bacteroidota bacterium]